MANDSAATHVGQTTELIELILSHLSPFDVAAATSVNHTFRNAILNSLTLRRKLFLRPKNALPQYWLRLQLFPIRTLFRAATVDPDSLEFEPTPESRFKRDEYRLPLKVVSTCPLLERPNEAQGFWATYKKSQEKLKWNQLSTSPHQWYFLPPKEINGPWKQMYLTDSPCKTVRCTLRWEGLVHGEVDITVEATRDIYRQSGVTFADLFDDTCSMLGPVIIRTDDKNEHFMTMPREGGGYECSVPRTTLHKQIERCKENNPEREMRFNN
jgi:hypothetical protein